MKFTEEQINKLQDNANTLSVSPAIIRYTLSFKMHFWERYKAGDAVTAIFRDAGYDPEMLGTARIESFVKRVKKEALSESGFTLEKRLRNKHPDLKEYQSMPAKEAIKCMTQEIAYLRQQIEFVKKMLLLENFSEK